MEADEAARAAKESLDEGRREYADLQQTASSQQQRARHLTKEAQIRLADLPRDIAAAVNACDDEILEQLQARLTELAGAPAALGQLETTEAELIAVSTASADIQNDLAQIPPDQRIPLAEAQAALQQAEKDLREIQGRRDTLRNEHNRLAKAQQLRARLGTQLAARAPVHARVVTLALVPAERPPWHRTRQRGATDSRPGLVLGNAAIRPEAHRGQLC